MVDFAVLLATHRCDLCPAGGSGRGGGRLHDHRGPVDQCGGGCGARQIALAGAMDCGEAGTIRTARQARRRSRQSAAQREPEGRCLKNVGAGHRRSRLRAGQTGAEPIEPEPSPADDIPPAVAAQPANDSRSAATFRQTALWLAALLVLVIAGLAMSPFWAPAVAPLLPWSAKPVPIAIDYSKLATRADALEERTPCWCRISLRSNRPSPSRRNGSTGWRRRPQRVAGIRPRPRRTRPPCSS